MIRFFNDDTNSGYYKYKGKVPKEGTLIVPIEDENRLAKLHTKDTYYRLNFNETREFFFSIINSILIAIFLFQVLIVTFVEVLNPNSPNTDSNWTLLLWQVIFYFLGLTSFFLIIGAMAINDGKYYSIEFINTGFNNNDYNLIKKYASDKFDDFIEAIIEYDENKIKSSKEYARKIVELASLNKNEIVNQNNENIDSIRQGDIENIDSIIQAKKELKEQTS